SRTQRLQSVDTCPQNKPRTHTLLLLRAYRFLIGTTESTRLELSFPLRKTSDHYPTTFIRIQAKCRIRLQGDASLVGKLHHDRAALTGNQFAFGTFTPRGRDSVY